MKKTLTLLSMSACVLLAFNSCRSGHMSEYDYETATTASDTIADGEIPPWLIDDEDDGWGGQIAAGATTHEHYPIPEPEETTAYSGGASQNQPAVAQQGATVHTEPVDTVIETPTPSPALAVNTPGTPSLIGVEPTTPTPAISKPKPVRKPVASTTKTSKPKKNKKAEVKKRGKRYTEPTLLTYKVRKGDNLSDIAKRSRTTVSQIKKDSGLKGDTIYPGQIIKVRYIPKDYKPNKAKAAKAKAKTTTHVVAKGQTISGIAKRYGVSYTDILKANGMSQKDAMRMRPGKRLVIPAGKKR